MRHEFEMSRRKVLAGIGAVGATSAGAGMGTSAYFNDTESFEGNEIVAGELDLKVGWQEHYSHPQLYGGTDPADGLRVIRTEPGDPSNYFGLPNPNDPMVWVHKDDFGTYWERTSIEAFPDENNDRIRDDPDSRMVLSQDPDINTLEEIEAAYRAQFANVPADLDSDLRTESSQSEPLIDLQDVKPGDFGEVTFSFHLFDNPGYIWFDAELVEASESGVTEPEDDEPQEDGSDVTVDSTSDSNYGKVELIDEIRVLVWHDNGDNRLGGFELVHAPHDVNGSTSIVLSQDEALITDDLGSSDSNGVLTLRELLEATSSNPHGIPLDADTRNSDRDCYPNSTTRYLGFAWWLPSDVGNEVQSDSVSFDLGFYTEQCRHNDGSGRPTD